jgi:hypothetical protein
VSWPKRGMPDDMDQAATDLGIRAVVAYRATVGYGDLYECRVENVLEGSLVDSTITVSVLAADAELSALLMSHGASGLELGFTRLRGGEPYAIAPISGFVDSQRTSWQITCARKSGPSTAGWTRPS